MVAKLEHKLQDDGLLLCNETLASKGRNIYNVVDEVLSPAATLRKHLLEAPLDLLSGPTAPSARVPFPLAQLETPGKYGSYTQLSARLAANLLNERIQSIDAGCRAGLAWYHAHVNQRETGQYAEYSLPQVKKVFPQYSNTEDLPEDLDLHPSDILPGPYVKAKVAFRNFAIQNMWSDSMTPHTPVLIFVKRVKPVLEHMVMAAYTILGETSDRPKQDGKQEHASRRRSKGKGKATEGGDLDELQALKDEKEEEDEQEKRNKGFAKEIWLRVSDTAYRSDAAFDNLRPSTRAQPYDVLRTPEIEIKVVRLDTLFFAEYDLSLLSRLAPIKQRALLRPADYAVKPDTFQLSDAEFAQFRSVAQPYTKQQLAPQQLRYAFNYVAFIVMRALAAQDTYGFLALGGPPGTGKTRTMCQAIIYSRQRSLLRHVVRYLLQYHHIQPHDVESIVGRALQQPVVYMAPTNEAVDEALDTLIAMLNDLPPEASLYLTGVRICNFDRAQRKPEHIRHHAIYAAASELLTEWHNEIASINGQQGVTQKAVDALQARLNAKEIGQEAFEEEKQRTYAQRQEPDAARSTRLNQRKQKLESRDFLPCLDAFVKDPASFGSAELTGSRKCFTKSMLALLERRVAEQVMKDWKVICFMTTGYPTPYQEAALDVLNLAVAVLDEASQEQLSDLVRILLDTIGLVACGDAKQLGAVVKGAEEGSVDLRINLMDKLAEQTLWLTLCFRLPCEVTYFLDEYRYSQSRLHSPKGQNILRWSPLHTIELFMPVVLLDSKESKEESVGTSKINKNEAEIIRNYLFHRHRAGVSARQPPIDVRIITPYAAQVEQLKVTCGVFAGCPSFKSFRIGSIETAQGSTTDLCIVSMVAARNAENILPNIGFIDEKRLTVAISRARINLLVVCNVSALKEANDGSNPLLASLLEPNLGPILYSHPSALSAAASGAMHRNLVSLDKPSACSAPVSTLEWLAQGESSDGADSAERIAARVAELTECLAVL